MYIYIHIHICCTTSSAQTTYWHVVQLVSTPLSIIIIVTRKRHGVTRTFDDEKDLWNYVHVHDMYISLGWGWLVLLPTCSMSRTCQYNTWRIIGPVIIMRSTFTGTSTIYRIQYLIHHATSIAMTSYLLALASTSIGDRSVSFSPRGRISPYMY